MVKTTYGYELMAKWLIVYKYLGFGIDVACL